MNYQIITIIVGSGIFLLLCIGASVGLHVYIGKHSTPALLKANRSIGLVSVFVTCFCMWLMWICTYMHQMNPLVHPVSTSHD